MVLSEGEQAILSKLDELGSMLKAINTSIRHTQFPDDALINIPQTLVTIATPVKPSDPDVLANAAAGTPGYDPIVIFNELHRLSPAIWVTNDGKGTLFAVATADAIKWSGESEILSGESRCFYNVYEIRVRSPDGTLMYRVSEYRPEK